MSELCVFITTQSQLEMHRDYPSWMFSVMLSGGPKIKPQGCRSQQGIDPSLTRCFLCSCELAAPGSLAGFISSQMESVPLQHHPWAQHP